MTLLRLEISGPLRVIGADGVERTPRGAKPRGLLALLATGRDFRRTRVQLMDKLWSSRGPDQAAASLRQALHVLRNDLGNDALSTGAGWVGLNPDEFEVSLHPTAYDVDGTVPEFAEGLDIPDPEFEDWIRDARAHFARIWTSEAEEPSQDPISEEPPSEPAPEDTTATAPPVRDGAVRRQDTHPVKLILPPPRGVDRHDVLSEMILRDAAQRAAHMVGAEVQDSSGAETGVAVPPGSLNLTCTVLEFPGRVVLQPSLSDPSSGVVLWNRTISGEADAMQALLDETTAAMSSAAVTQVSVARRVSRQVPLFDAFSFDAERLLRADKRLGEDDRRLGETPVRLAYRAWLRHTLVMERLTPLPEEALEEANEMMRYAREAAPFNQFILAVDSLIHGARGQDELALELALEARKLDPSHAFVRKSLSVALSFTGHTEEAHREALLAGRNQMSPLAPAFFDLRKAYTAIGVGDPAAALKWALAAVQRAPDLRAAHRVVAALQYAEGDVAKAQASLQTLKRLEPDFSLELMASDDYPVDSLRKAGLLNVTASGLLVNEAPPARTLPEAERRKVCTPEKCPPRPANGQKQRQRHRR